MESAEEGPFQYLQFPSLHIQFLQYNPESLQNESLAEAVANLFGTKGGEITYRMFEDVLDLEDKISTWLVHQSILNGGNLDGVA